MFGVTGDSCTGSCVDDGETDSQIRKIKKDDQVSELKLLYLSGMLRIKDTDLHKQTWEKERRKAPCMTGGST